MGLSCFGSTICPGHATRAFRLMSRKLKGHESRTSDYRCCHTPGAVGPNSRAQKKHAEQIAPETCDTFILRSLFTAVNENRRYKTAPAVPGPFYVRATCKSASWVPSQGGVDIFGLSSHGKNGLYGQRTNFLWFCCPAPGDRVKLKNQWDRRIAEITRAGRRRRLPGGGGKGAGWKAVTKRQFRYVCFFRRLLLRNAVISRSKCFNILTDYSIILVSNEVDETFEEKKKDE